MSMDIDELNFLLVFDTRNLNDEFTLDCKGLCSLEYIDLQQLWFSTATHVECVVGLDVINCRKILNTLISSSRGSPSQGSCGTSVGCIFKCNGSRLYIWLIQFMWRFFCEQSLSISKGISSIVTSLAATLNYSCQHRVSICADVPVIASTYAIK